WCPRRPGVASTAATNGMFVGEIAAVAMTLPLLLPLLGGHWELVLASWSVPVVATLLAVLALSPVRSPGAGLAPRPTRPWPDWRSPLAWRLGLILGGSSITYWGSNAFIPEYLTALGRPDLITASLTSLNVLQLPATALVAAFPDPFIGRRLPLALAAGLT